MEHVKSMWRLYGHQVVRAGFLAIFAFAAYGIATDYGISLHGQFILWPVAFLLWLFIAIQIEPIYEPIEDNDSNTTGTTGSVTINFKLNDGEYGSEEERKNIHNITDELDLLVTNENIGEYDGDEFGNGECELYFYSDEPEKLYNKIKPILIKTSFIKSATVEIENINGESKKELLNNR